MYFRLKPPELHYIFLSCFGTEIINIHKVPSPRLLVWQSHFCKEVSTLPQTSPKAERVSAEHLKAKAMCLQCKQEDTGDTQDNGKIAQGTSKGYPSSKPQPQNLIRFIILLFYRRLPCFSFHPTWFHLQYF